MSSTKNFKGGEPARGRPHVDIPYIYNYCHVVNSLVATFVYSESFVNRLLHVYTPFIPRP